MFGNQIFGTETQKRAGKFARQEPTLVRPLRQNGNQRCVLALLESIANRAQACPRTYGSILWYVDEYKGTFVNDGIEILEEIDDRYVFLE